MRKSNLKNAFLKIDFLIVLIPIAIGMIPVLGFELVQMSADEWLKIAFNPWRNLNLTYEAPAHPRFWLVESLLPLFKPFRFHGFDFVLRRFSLGSLPHMRDFQLIIALSRREWRLKMG